MNIKGLLGQYLKDKKNNYYDPDVIRCLLALRKQYFKTQQKHNFYLIPFSV